MLRNTTTVILAGGKGTRLEPLTLDRAKPAVPFGGNYRIIDFVMSNAINSGLRRLLVLTQYKALSLDRHINLGWRQYFCAELGEFLDVVPPQQRIDEQWYQGTADAVYQNIFVIEKDRPEYVVILAGDHIYKMNYQSMIDYHREMEADLTVGALTVDRESAKQFGVIQADEDNRIRGFQEKPAEPQTLPGEDNRCFASMGIYVFTARFLFEQLCRDATEPDSQHDFGKNIIPSIIDSHRVFAFPFRDENRKRQAYWRDVGTIDAYYEANMDLIDVDPLLNLYDEDWPIRTLQPNLPPPKFVFGSDGDPDRCGIAVDSTVCPGTIISGGKVKRSLISSHVRINSYASVEESILFQGVNIGRHARVRRAIIDKDVCIPADMEIGYDLELDRRRGFTVSSNGIVVISRNDSLNHPEDGLRVDPPSRILR
ncbi:glucose-1-phosphate adenylyltransferase [Aureliella helgolandensis]|uniref:Glucose-1-phosphate adenylyltransferase n=1 Tax=Aureliella helgolandensis TaxID=2527968 RepID=A0A518G105_9BACT|nr:glucose-1-phosphate adenylyltransferase [Aureliella helgolandensis]QDV22288.1 Glucose-1-phosphate adenylyltransferase [Aureliella helgolandensis]